MIFNWVYLGQQLLVALLSGALATVCLLAAGRMRKGGAGSLWIEFLALALGLFLVGMFCEPLGYGALLPNLEFPWTVGVAMAFYWMAVWWPLRVVLRRGALRRTAAGKMTLAGAAACVGGALYSVFVEPYLLEGEPRELVLAEIKGRPIRVAHVSDTQAVGLGPREEAFIEAVNAFDPHFIVFTGDYIAGIAGEDAAIEAMRSVFSRLETRHGIFATRSDCDNDEHRARIFEGFDITYLNNTSTTIEVEGVRVRIAGLDHDEPDYEAIAAGAQPDELFLVGSHWPDHAEEVSRRIPEADAYFAGHTHGGQIQIPGLGPPITMCDSPRHIAAGGVFETDRGMPYFVTRGIGSEGDYAPRFRFNCRPHLFLLTLRGEKSVSR